VEVNVRGGEGGIREVEKEYEGGWIHAFDEEGRTGSIGDRVSLQWDLQCTGAEEVLGSEG
jgi:hypothetical protein